MENRFDFTNNKGEVNPNQKNLINELMDNVNNSNAKNLNLINNNGISPIIIENDKPENEKADSNSNKN